jgi:hypothetical protein
MNVAQRYLDRHRAHTAPVKVEAPKNLEHEIILEVLYKRLRDKDEQEVLKLVIKGLLSEIVEKTGIELPRDLKESYVL